jgi:hypothetical protein
LVDFGQVTDLISMPLAILIHHLLEYDHAIATYKYCTGKQKTGIQPPMKMVLFPSSYVIAWPYPNKEWGSLEISRNVDP